MDYYYHYSTRRMSVQAEALPCPCLGSIGVNFYCNIEGVSNRLRTAVYSGSKGAAPVISTKSVGGRQGKAAIKVEDDAFISG